MQNNNVMFKIVLKKKGDRSLLFFYFSEIQVMSSILDTVT